MRSVEVELGSAESSPMAVPEKSSVLLPPDPTAPHRVPPPPPEGSEVTKATQATRAALRRRFLQCLAAARGHPVTFTLRQRVRVGAVMGAVGFGGVGGVGDFQVDALQTPLGVQAAAVLRGTDVVAFGFREGGKGGGGEGK